MSDRPVKVANHVILKLLVRVTITTEVPVLKEAATKTEILENELLAIAIRATIEIAKVRETKDRANRDPEIVTRIIAIRDLANKAHEIVTRIIEIKDPANKAPEIATKITATKDLANKAPEIATRINQFYTHP